MKSIDIYGFGNGIVDILLEVNDAEFEQLQTEKATMRLVSEEEQKNLLSQFSDRTLHLVSGGSVANSVILASQLGAKCAFATSLGDDRYGLHYKGEFDSLGIDLGNPLAAGGVTGTSAIIITPDAERTMRTCLGISAKFDRSHVDKDVIRHSQWIFIEGYLLSNSEETFDALLFGVQEAKNAHTRIALTVSESWIVDGFRDRLDQLAPSVDLIFCNETEGRSLAGANASDAQSAFTILKGLFPNVVVTCGEKGVLVSYGGEVTAVNAFPCE
ncbi:MAG: adenosine kinase, partial [Bdellovibrionales bacterium]|nr:adenosine kinase [Bdellovibrionales bacterium]